MTPLQAFKELEDQVVYVRWLHEGLESAEEDALLDRLDAAYRELSLGDRARADLSPPKSKMAPRTGRILVDSDVLSRPNQSPRVLVDAA